MSLRRDPAQVRKDFDQALDALVERLRDDPTVVAALLWGSLAYDEVWDRSDIDLTIVRDDRKARQGSGGIAIASQGVNIHAIVQTRAEFRKWLASSVLHWGTQITLGRILFTKDESLRRLFDEVSAVGERDRRVRLLEVGSGLVTLLTKAEKFLHVKRDPHYAAVWVNHVVNRLASVEVLLHKQAPNREAVLQALELNPKVFGPLHTEFADRKKTHENVEAALTIVERYLTEHLDDIFGPLLEYLEDEATIRSVSDIEQHFTRRMDAKMISFACEWLADRGVLVKASVPVRLNEHSRVELEELAFVHPGARS